MSATSLAGVAPTAEGDRTLSTRLAAVLGGGLLLVALAAHAVPAVRYGLDYRSWAADTNVIEFTVPALAAGLLWWRARRDGNPGWSLLALGCAAWSAGQVAWWILESFNGELPTPSAADIGFLAWPVLTVAGLVRLGPISTVDRASRRVVVTEALLLATGVGFLLWHLVLLSAIERGSGTTVEELLLVVYPVSSAAVAATAFLLYVTNRSPALAAIGLGATLNAAADAVLSSDIDESSLATYLVSHAGWTLGFVLLGCAAVLPFRPRPLDRRHPALVRTLIITMVVVTCVAVAIWRFAVEDEPVDRASAVLALVGVVLLAAHQVAQWAEASRLADQLDESIERLESSGRELRSLLDNLAESVVVLDREGFVVEANQPASRLSGLDRDQLVGGHFVDLVPSRDLARLQEVWEQLLGGVEGIARPVFDVDRPDGTAIVVEADARPVRGGDGRVVLSLRDVTERLRTERALLEAERRFRLTFDAAPTGMCLVAPADGRIVAANDALARMLGTTPEDLEGELLRDHVHPDDREQHVEVLDATRVLQAPGTSIRQRFVRADGSVVWGATSVSYLPVPEGEALVIAHVVDVSEEVRSSEQLAWSATHDDVTGLANRSHFLDRLRRVLGQPQRPPVAVLFLDLDRFKVVNDSLGHAVGDDLLRAMASRLRDAVRHGDLVARFGGDEFTVLLHDADPEVAGEVADRIRRSLAVPIVLGDALVDVTGSIGMTLADPDALVEAEELVRDADAAMYRAKERGRDRVEAFTPETRTASLQALVGRNELRQAIEDDQIVPYFQPIVELTTGRLTGYEVVARWLHPERGLLTPDSFLPAAEERGLIGLLGAGILRSALAQLARWQGAGTLVGPLSVSVNVSARQLVDTSFVDVVAAALAESGIPADALWLELTETALMADVRSATNALRELRSLGLHLAVDDFGTGYSSLTYLKRFPVEAIKIDRAFVAGLGLDVDDSAIVEAVIRLGGSLGLRVIAEGVETPLQLARLRDLECGWAQGYLFGRPRPAELLEPFQQV